MPSVPKSAAEPVQVLIIMIWTFLYSACQPLLDAIIVKYLKDEGIGKELYGRQRLWASIGYIVVTMAVAKAIDGSGKKIEDVRNA